MLRTPNKPLCPETAAAGRMIISETVFYVRFHELATIAHGTRREIELEESFPQPLIFAIVPNFK
jgi:hypothetical protein